MFSTTLIITNRRFFRAERYRRRLLLTFVGQTWDHVGGNQSQLNPGQLLSVPTLPPVPRGGSLLAYLLNMYVSYWSFGSHNISTEEQKGDNEGLVFSFLYLDLSATWCISQRNLFRLPHLSPGLGMKMWIPAPGPSHTANKWHRGGGPPPKFAKEGRTWDLIRNL